MNPHRNATETELIEREPSQAIPTELSPACVCILLCLDGVSGALKVMSSEWVSNVHERSVALLRVAALQNQCAADTAGGSEGRVYTRPDQTHPLSTFLQH